MLRLPLSDCQGQLTQSSASTSSNNIPTVPDALDQPSTALGLSISLPSTSQTGAAPTSELVSHASVLALHDEPALLIATAARQLPLAPAYSSKASTTAAAQAAETAVEDPMAVDNDLLFAFTATEPTATTPAAKGSSVTTQKFEELASVATTEAKLSLCKLSVKWQADSLNFGASNKRP